MPTIGTRLRTWTAFLLLCSPPATALVQAANSSVTFNTGATAVPSVTQHGVSIAPSQSTPFTRSYADTDTICLYRTINYITHTLPQQCLRTSWSAPVAAASTNGTVPAADATSTPHILIPSTNEGAVGEANKSADTPPSTHASSGEDAGSGDSATRSGTASTEPDTELETDSPFDNANFLSFDEWKKRNLAQAGQSPENVGQGRAASTEQGPRRRPVNVNALDSLGEEAEIDIDFSGFGNPSEGSDIGNEIASRAWGADTVKSTRDADKAGSGSWELSKDAGKTCKERFNYASFDCAATVLKTNKKAKGSSAVLSEHKDSYMLNECSVDNKFFIVELCDDILVDTVVLANYEFFSSSFRHIRVSVSDKYPVKMERWRTLATFEARNSREIQPFLITEPQIWARYLRLEFLTHYGNEFYCPLSLLRVHGTTMMEQFRREEEEARGGEDDADSIEEEEDVVKPADGSGPIPADRIPIILSKLDATKPTVAVSVESKSQTAVSSSDQPTSNQAVSPPASSSAPSASGQAPAPANISRSIGTSPSNDSVNHSSIRALSPVVSESASYQNDKSTVQEQRASGTATTSQHAQVPLSSPSHTAGNAASSSEASMAHKVSARSPGPDTPASPPNNANAKPVHENAGASPPSPSQPRPSPTQPNAAAPSTQESFFKSLHKRLQYLEANSTLSLQYIEEQSRILRDAFVKVEKKQLAKTEKFLGYMNTTVISELKHYRTLYEQLWQSTVIELEGMKERQRSEMGEVGARLSMMADELVWQKRMAVVQSTLLLLCLGLVLFARSGTMGVATDMPIVQQLGTKYSSFFDSPPPQRGAETGVERRRRTFKNMWRSDASTGLSDRSGHEGRELSNVSDMDSDDARSPVQIEYSPPTPDTPDNRFRGAPEIIYSSPDVNGTADEDIDGGLATPRMVPDIDPDDQAKRIQVLATQSGPATPNGTRDSRPSWEEVDRAIDQLKAEEQDQVVPQKEIRVKGKARSPLRRAQSSYDGVVDENSFCDSGSELFAGS
ncbi:UNC-like C-terminal-domain-containing protein [Boeremia exigua]|uniref:UNC-like C-terminal-domain-containing protein n=1 Tax=Boeremia exigua TaxID=749465 RepID=UPI001E8CFFFD|nr:UNC-like C-terminal-domain-containing protein [Boeremia exigua]KAH6622307.1 UNC-like C-terminal-domain-containing protein [Boeremia exigua]